MNRKITTAIGIAGFALSAVASAQVTFFQGDGFRGRSFTADRPVANLERQGFNDRASSAIVDSGTWQVCEDARFNGRCVVLQPGRYESLQSIGLDNEISSVRPVEQYGGYAPPAPAPRVADAYDSRRPVMAAPVAPPDYDRRDSDRRPDERTYEAPVTSVHAVVGPPEQRCWVERENVSSGGPNVGGAILGGVLGGVLGHQVGAGRGREVATVGGAVAGAAIGGNVNRDDRGTYGRDVQRCSEVSSNASPDYWDVTYTFRGVEHRIQTQSPPGSSIPVNRDGEPRL